MKIILNQVGFDPAAPKRALLIDESPIHAASFVVKTADGRAALEADAGPEETIPAWPLHIRALEFSQLKEPGEYRIESAGLTSPPFRIAEGEPGQSTLHPGIEFFYIQRCGMAIPGWHDACHLDDALLPDGAHRDAAGGWHDAGDYNKYSGYTPLALYALLNIHEDARPFYDQRRREGRPAIYDEAQWGARFLIKMIDPADGHLIRDVYSGYGYWGRPEDETDNIPGTEKSRKFRDDVKASYHPEMAVAAFAHMAMADPENPAWLDAALKIWQTVDQLDQPEIKRLAEALLASLALARITGEPQYHELAEKQIAQLIERQDADGGWGETDIVDQGMPAAALAIAALSEPNWKDRLVPVLTRYLDRSLALSRNPFGVLQYDADNYFFNFKDPKTWYVGQNSMLLSEAWAAALIARLCDEPRAREHAVRQVDWVLGRNPFGLCLMDDVGSEHTPRYHHRYDQCPGHPMGAVPGGVVNGIIRESPEADRPYYDLTNEKRTRYQSNEVWLPHNAYYLLAVTELCLVPAQMR